MTDTTEIGNQLRLDLLREALPYIQRFKGKTFVVKLSGKVTEAHEGLISLAEELALMHQVGIRLCVVHGGGKQLSDEDLSVVLRSLRAVLGRLGVKFDVPPFRDFEG